MSVDEQKQPVRFLLGSLKNPRHPRFAHLLFLAPSPLLLGLLFGSSYMRVAVLIILAIVGLSVWLLRSGLKAQLAYDAAEVMRRPKWPLKLIGATIIGPAMALLALRPSGSGLEAGLTALVAIVLAVVAFGPDPLKHKGLETAEGVDKLRAEDMVVAAERHVEQMAAKLAPLADDEISAGFSGFEAAARKLFAAVRRDPAHRRNMRRHLGVYLESAMEATTRFATIYDGSGDGLAKARYLGLLDDLTSAFLRQAESYQEGARTGFDIEIDVLSERLHDSAA